MKKFLALALTASLLAMSLSSLAFAEEATEEEAMEATEEAAQATEEAAEETAFTTVTVTTAFGDVLGADNGTTQVFYGIPYGAAPVGELRWQPPVDPTPWTEARDCTQPFEKAMQYVTDSETGITIGEGTDDCLNLDVYTTEGAENLPVLVYIHGGNNQSGNSQEIEGNEIVARDNCVYVSLSYRLGLLGFNCLPALVAGEGSTGNFTLLDIAKALDWVAQNIAAFGGDPSNITVSGFSAGGRDVMAMLISPYFEGKFQKAIAFSGGMTTADVEMSQSQIASFMAPMVVEDGKAEDEEAAKAWLLTDGEDVKEYLYSLDSSRLAGLVGNANIRMASFPHLYEDDVILPKGGFDANTYFSVPVMMLTGSTEFSFFNNFNGYFFSPDYTSLSEEAQAAGIAFGCKYGSDMYRIFNTQMSAEKMFDNYGSDIYLCQIDYGCETSASVIDGFGSFHGIFVPMLADINGYGFYDYSQAGYQAMSADFNAYLTNFLATGDPNGEGLAQWPTWESEEKLTQVFDADESTGTASIEAKNVYKTYEEIMDEMDADETVEDEVKAKVIAGSMNGRWFSDAVDQRYGNASLWK